MSNGYAIGVVSSVALLPYLQGHNSHDLFKGHEGLPLESPRGETLRSHTVSYSTN